jgi:cadmium resistance protein CadD (predicted permease)
LNPQWISLLGVVPIVIGIKKLFATTDQQQTPTTSGVIDVALITFANGGDNIGIYAPLFATADASQLAIVLVVFYLMLALWCWCGYLIARQPFVAIVLRRYGRWIVPFVLMALGVYILIGSRI